MLSSHALILFHLNCECEKSKVLKNGNATTRFQRYSHGSHPICYFLINCILCRQEILILFIKNNNLVYIKKNKIFDKIRNIDIKSFRIVVYYFISYENISVIQNKHFSISNTNKCDKKFDLKRFGMKF